jgi:hypothetical protein
MTTLWRSLRNFCHAIEWISPIWGTRIRCASVRGRPVVAGVHRETIRDHAVLLRRGDRQLRRVRRAREHLLGASDGGLGDRAPDQPRSSKPGCRTKATETEIETRQVLPIEPARPTTCAGVRRRGTGGTAGGCRNRRSRPRRSSLDSDTQPADLIVTCPCRPPAMGPAITDPRHGDFVERELRPNSPGHVRPRLFALVEGVPPAGFGLRERRSAKLFGAATSTETPVELAKAPRVIEEEIEPFDIDDIQRLIATALTRRNGVRFVLALAIGTRQGETIGLKWSRLNDKTRTLTIVTQLQRQTWEHGCDDPHACGAARHKTQPCREGCARHQRACPPPCPPDCTAHARRCPRRRGGGLVESDVKSTAVSAASCSPWSCTRCLCSIEHGRNESAVTLAPEGRVDVRPIHRPAARSSARPGRLEGFAPGSGCTGSSTARRTTHSCHRAAYPRCARASCDGVYGLVEQCDGEAVPACHGRAPERHRQSAQPPTLAGRSRL